MTCPRCGEPRIRTSRTTLIGKESETVPGIRSDDVVVVSYFCADCKLLEEASSELPDEVERLTRRWASGSQLEQPVAWTPTGDPVQPYEATVAGATWRLRANDYPRQERYTLIVDGEPRQSFSHWPAAWRRDR